MTFGAWQLGGRSEATSVKIKPDKAERANEHGGQQLSDAPGVSVTVAAKDRDDPGGLKIPECNFSRVNMTELLIANCLLCWTSWGVLGRNDEERGLLTGMR